MYRDTPQIRMVNQMEKKMKNYMETGICRELYELQPKL